MGMTGDAEFVFEKLEDVLAIPGAYIKTEKGVSTVTVVKDGKQEKREVVTGAKIDGMAQIVSGLQENEVLYSN